MLPSPAGDWQAPESFSNDGTEVLVIRGAQAIGAGDPRPAVVPVAGAGPSVEIPYPGGMDADPTAAWQWAPDDSSVLGTPTSAAGDSLDVVLLDPVMGSYRTPPWSGVTRASWQRIGD